MSILSSAVPAGASMVPASPPFGPCPFVIVGKGTPQAELHKVTSVSGVHVSLATPLTGPHAKGVEVRPFDGGLVPAVWMGLRLGGSETDATVNTDVLNRLSQRIYQIGVATGLGGIRIDGHFYVNDVIRLERDQAFEGESPTATTIRAAASFPFDDTGEKAVIVGYRDGVKTSYANLGPTARWYLRRFQINCHGRPNSNGILASSQQPGVWSELRIDEAKGLYGLCLADTQQHKLRSLSIFGCNVGLRYRAASFVYCDDLNIEQSDTADFISEGIGPYPVYGGHNNSFRDVHLEDKKPVVNFDVASGRMWTFENVWATQKAGSTTFRFRSQGSMTEQGVAYTIENAQWSNSEDSFAIDDQSRVPAQQVRVHTDLKGHLMMCLAGNHNYATDTINTHGQHALWILGAGGKQVRIGCPGIGSGRAPNIRSTVPAGDYHAKLYDTAGNVTARVGSAGAWEDMP